MSIIILAFLVYPFKINEATQGGVKNQIAMHKLDFLFQNIFFVRLIP